jgi:hypothetical protein
MPIALQTYQTRAVALWGRRRLGLERWAIRVLLVPTLVGCSSSYEPARSPRIVTVMEGGAPHFVKDGMDYGSPLFGGGLVDAVEGNARAEAEARTGRNLTIAGFVFDVAGLGSELTGLVVLEQERGRSNTGLGLTLAGLAGVLIGSTLLISAPPHMYDAVNIYNDGLGRDVPRPQSPETPR